MRQLGVLCVVVAPSMTPKRSGDRIKTDRRDALKLARLLRAGELKAIYIPEPTDEAIRVLCGREPMRSMICAAVGIKALLLRHGYVIMVRVPGQSLICVTCANWCFRILP
jgi:transposase